MKRISAFLLSMIAVASLGVGMSFGCVCGVPTVEDAFQVSERIFSGKSVSIVVDSVSGLILVEFEADRVWKGPQVQNQVVNTGPGSCQYSFTVGETYLVYAAEGREYSQEYFPGMPNTSICTRTKRMSQAQDDLAYLQEGVAVGTDPTLPDHRGRLEVEVYPNPAASRVVSTFVLPHSGQVDVGLYNLLGQQVELLWRGFQPAGRHSIETSVSPVPRGLYVLHIRSGEDVAATLFIRQ